MAKPVLEFRINGKRWLLVRERIPDALNRDGDCDHPDTPNKKVRIDTRLRGKQELETYIHEVRHAENFKMYSEEYVKEVSHDLTNLLWRLGYRRDPSLSE